MTDFNKKELIKIEPLNPLSKETEPNQNAVALIIGIGDMKMRLMPNMQTLMLNILLNTLKTFLE